MNKYKLVSLLFYIFNGAIIAITANVQPNQLSSINKCDRDLMYCNVGGGIENVTVISWKESQSNLQQILPIFENTTICLKGIDGYWTPTITHELDNETVDWAPCSDQDCDPYDLCKEGIKWDIFEKSVKLKIPNNVDTVIILEKSQSECAISAQCQDCESVKNEMKKFSKCKMLQINSDNDEWISFDNLEPNTKYLFRVLPMKGEQLSGSVFKLNLQTLTKIELSEEEVSKTNPKIELSKEEVSKTNEKKRKKKKRKLKKERKKKKIKSKKERKRLKRKLKKERKKLKRKLKKKMKRKSKKKMKSKFKKIIKVMKIKFKKIMK